MRIVMIGTRGVPAAYGGFETAVEEIGKRLVARGHTVTVYCRNMGKGRPSDHLGMTLVHLPAIRAKVVETLSHTALSVLHANLTGRHDAAFVFNAANAPFVPVLQAKGIPTAVHVDGLEWKRGKWGPMGRRFYRWAEGAAVARADALIADARGIADYYEDEFGVPTELLTYGAPILTDVGHERIASLGLRPKGYHLVVARFELENHVDVIVDGYRRSRAAHPLVVVGSAPYAAEYTEAIARSAALDDRIALLGGIYDQPLLDELYANSLTYLHGHSVGGTNPSLLRAMGAASASIAFDVVFNREVLGEEGRYFADAREAAAMIEAAEGDVAATMQSGALLQLRAADRYDWDVVTDGYEALAERLATGYSSRSRGRRRAAVVPEVRVESRVGQFGAGAN